MKPDPISEGFKKAVKKLDKAKDNIDLLPRSVATFLFVHSAQGVIDNGNYEYLFGSDWPKKPPYSRFVEAYEAIGCKKQAKELARVVSTFPFDNPHLKEAARKRYIKENYDDENYEVKGWGKKLCGDEEVWEKLRKYYLINKKDFA
jgi:hypothetical protein